jgi:hypothetical protein
MGSVSRIIGGIGAAALTGATLGAVPSSAQAMSGPKAIRVPCNPGALVTAIQTHNGTGPAKLRLAPYCVYNYTTVTSPGDALPVITGDITLTGGPSTRIRRDPGSPAFRLMEVASGGKLRVQGIYVEGGSAAGQGGGILNAGTVVLYRTTFSGNTAANGGAFSNSAGAKATISRSLFTMNATTSVGGGAIMNFATLTLYKSILSKNSAPINGGGLNTQPAGVSNLTRTTVADNTSGGLGGGISNLGTTKLDRVLVERNTGTGGGGIATGNTNVTLRKSIVRANTPDNCNPLNTIPGCPN